MKRLSISFSLLFIVLLSGCTIAIKNIEFCRDKGKLGAKCAYWLNAKETLRTVPATEWNSKRTGMVCTSEKGMGNINALIESLCQNAQCREKVGDLIKALE